MNQYVLKKTDEILHKEELKRLSRAKLNNMELNFTFYDTKGELFEIRELLPKLHRALNGSDSRTVCELCILINKRLNLIYQQHKQ